VNWSEIPSFVALNQQLSILHSHSAITCHHNAKLLTFRNYTHAFTNVLLYVSLCSESVRLAALTSVIPPSPKGSGESCQAFVRQPALFHSAQHISEEVLFPTTEWW
jgi:hypothetical protein